MYPEKPKNKRKHSDRLRRQMTYLIAGIIVLVGIGLIFTLIPILFPAQISITDLQTVHIQNHWMGLSRIAPIKADYYLNLTADGTLTGTATYSITHDEITETVDITIPADVIDTFIDKLESAKLQRGTYTPFSQWTDDYPSLAININTVNTIISIYSTSQGEFHVPWGATIDGTDYIINSTIPAEALDILTPYLKQDVQEAMIDEHGY